MHWQTIQVDSDWILSRPMTQFNPFTLAWKHVKRHHYPCDRGFKRGQYTVTAWTGLENLTWTHLCRKVWNGVSAARGVTWYNKHDHVTGAWDPTYTAVTVWGGLENVQKNPWQCDRGLETLPRTKLWQKSLKVDVCGQGPSMWKQLWPCELGFNSKNIGLTVWQGL